MKQADAVNHQRGNAVTTAVRLNLASAMTSPNARESLLKAHIGSGLHRALQLRGRGLELRVRHQLLELRVAYQLLELGIH
jgi:hypothetical protein